MSRLLCAVVLLLFAAISAAHSPALAVQPDEMLADPVLEQRARDISQHLRCLVCQNQSIDDSNADLARDLRILVRERLVAGDSDEQVIAFVVARYGDFVLLKPPVKESTLPLWLGPFALVILGAIAVAIYYARRGGVQPPPLSAAERERLDKLLRGEDR